MSDKSVVSNYKEAVITLLVIIILLVSNPNEQNHRKKLIDIQSRISGIELIDDTIGNLAMHLGLGLGGFEYNNYYLFSIGKVSLTDELASIGVAGFVFIL
tara:strand:- start:95 stop:394 length:300 start_codon:yes stop_codon:yes gene_type:complete